MKNKNLFTFLLIFLFLCASESFFPQNEMDGVKVTDAGTFTGEINGVKFSDPIRYSESSEIVTIATGDESFTLTINCKGISSISQLQSGTHKLPSSEEVTIAFLDHKNAIPAIVSKGNFVVTENSEKILKGTIEFTASAGGIPKEMGGTEYKLSSGEFVINKK